MSGYKRLSVGWNLILRLSLPVAGIVACILTWLVFFGYRATIEVPVSAIRAEQGRAYYLDLRRLNQPFVTRGDSNSRPSSSGTVVREDGTRLGPAHSVHQDIRDLGGGRFSHWREGLYFSASDNTDPRVNAKTYVLEFWRFLPVEYCLVAAGLLTIALIANRHLLARAARAMSLFARKSLVLRWTWHYVMPSCVGSVLLVLAIGAAGEGYFRLTTPFSEVKWPSRFDPRIGFLFEPNAELRYTNHLDYWVVERINSLGFADREPDPNGVRPGCRVIFIGDSMVEAAQVQNNEKLQVVLEKKASAMHPDWQLNSAAFGYSGTGQLNQLPFYDTFVSKLRPKLVVLVFASNDFANNSSLLEALRNGWHPDHPPRLFLRRDQRTGSYEWIRIDPEWKRYLLKTDMSFTHRNGKQANLHSFVEDHSLFYAWLWRKFGLFYPEFVSRVDGPSLPEIIAARVDALRRLGSYQKELKNWESVYNLDLDAVFYEQELTEVFDEALGFTEFALSEFRRRVIQDEGNLVILTTSQLSLPRASLRGDGQNDSFISRRAFLRLESIARRVGIPVIDQYTYVKEKGGDLLAAQFRNDSHWTRQGHVWAADAVLQYLEQHPQICRPQ